MLTYFAMLPKNTMALRLPLTAARRTARMLHAGQYPRRATFSTRISAPKCLGVTSRSKSPFGVFAPYRLFSNTSDKQYASSVIKVPTMAESITEGTLVQISKQVGDFVEQDEELATIETDKIDVSVNAPHSGIIQRLLVSEGDTVTMDQTIAELEFTKSTSGGSTGNSSTKKDSQDTTKKHQEAEGPPKQTESPKSIAPSTSSQDTTPPALESKNLDKPAVEANTQQDSKHNRTENRVKMTRIRQKTAQHLKQSQNSAAFLTTFNEVDMSQLMKFRSLHRDEVLKEHGIKLGYMGAMARAASLALKEIPAVNAAIGNGDTIVYRDYVDLSVAAAIPKGLVTPVLRNIESMGIVEIEKNISGLVAKARDGKLTMDDLTGGSFTISNSGVWGSLFGTPIINMPQTAVLGVYGIQDRPVAVDGQVEIRPMMYIALTYDHRIIDGREAVKFLNLFKGYLEEPNSMLLH